jgi:hypothetical protein
MILKLFIFLLMVTQCWAEGSCITALNQTYLSYNSQNIEVTLSCIGDVSTGTVPAATIPFKDIPDSSTVFNFPKGYSLADYFLYSIETEPVSSPVTAYTVTVSNHYGTILWALSSRSTTAKELAYILTDHDGYPMITGPITIQLGTIGASKRVDLRILFRAIKRTS